MQNPKPNPQPKTEQTDISVRFGAVRFGLRFAGKKCPGRATANLRCNAGKGRKEGRPEYAYRYCKHRMLDPLLLLAPIVIGHLRISFRFRTDGFHAWTCWSIFTVGRSNWSWTI
jgi:hypothetical protein